MPSFHGALPEEIFKQVRAIEIRTRRLVNDIFMGQYSSAFKGKGMEFSQVREYQPGDDPKLIDWNVTARTGHLFTKEFAEERELTVIFLLDASRSLFFGSRKNLKSECAAELAALLSFSAIRNGDKVGLVAFTDRVEKFVPPRKGSRNILRLVREILTFQPEGNSTDIAGALEFVGRVVKRRAVVFLISDFMAELDYEKALKSVSRRHDLIALRVSDRLEEAIPVPLRLAVRDCETGELVCVDLRNKADCESVADESRKFFDRWRQSARRSGVDLIEVRSGEPYVLSLLSFFKERARRFR